MAKSYAATIYASGGEWLTPQQAEGFQGAGLGATLSVCPLGTNINDAMLMAVQLLESSNRAELLSAGSVSLIILLTDGDPTVGEGTAQPLHVTLHRGSSCTQACWGAWAKGISLRLFWL